MKRWMFLGCGLGVLLLTGSVTAWARYQTHQQQAQEGVMRQSLSQALERARQQAQNEPHAAISQSWVQAMRTCMESEFETPGFRTQPNAPDPVYTPHPTRTTFEAWRRDTEAHCGRALVQKVALHDGPAPASAVHEELRHLGFSLPDNPRAPVAESWLLQAHLPSG